MYKLFFLNSSLARVKTQHGVGLCRTGQGPSPWAKLEAEKSRASGSAAGSSGNKADNAAMLMRTGIPRQGAGQRNRGRARGRGGGRKKGIPRSY